jgi:hypothetical protein
MCWEGSASDTCSSMRVVTRRTRLEPDSSATSQPERSVTTRRLFWRRMRFLAGVPSPPPEGVASLDEAVPDAVVDVAPEDFEARGPVDLPEFWTFSTTVS